VVVVAGGLDPPVVVARRRSDPLPLRVAADVLTELRRAKSEGKRSMRAPIDRVVVTDTAERLAALELALDDVAAAGVATEITTQVGDAFAVAVTLPPD
jgi:valyl-tRNA synthetase